MPTSLWKHLVPTTSLASCAHLPVETSRPHHLTRIMCPPPCGNISSPPPHSHHVTTSLWKHLVPTTSLASCDHLPVETSRPHHLTRIMCPPPCGNISSPPPHSHHVPTSLWKHLVPTTSLASCDHLPVETSRPHHLTRIMCPPPCGNISSPPPHSHHVTTSLWKHLVPTTSLASCDHLPVETSRPHHLTRIMCPPPCGNISSPPPHSHHVPTSLWKHLVPTTSLASCAHLPVETSRPHHLTRIMCPPPCGNISSPPPHSHHVTTSLWKHLVPTTSLASCAHLPVETSRPHHLTRIMCPPPCGNISSPPPHSHHVTTSLWKHLVPTTSLASCDHLPVETSRPHHLTRIMCPPPCGNISSPPPHSHHVPTSLWKHLVPTTSLASCAHLPVETSRPHHLTRIMCPPPCGNISSPPPHSHHVTTSLWKHLVPTTSLASCAHLPVETSRPHHLTRIM